MAINEITSIDVKTLPPFKRMIMTLGELPTSYLESMTYAELLMWFCNFLQEKVLPAINNNADALQDVINYLENLDLQDEVNNKLDEMAESGQLQEIVAEYLNSKALFGFDTVADMKSATNFIDGSYAKTLGYHEKNDGGSATYKIRQITNDDVVDEKFIIELNDDDLIAELIINDNIINVKQIGAKGDNTQDDTLFIQSAITKAKDINCVVYIPCGKYKITSTLHLYHNSCLKGSNGGFPWISDNSQSVINCVLATNTNAVIVDDSDSNIYITGITFVSDSCRVRHQNGYDPATLKYSKDTTVENVNGLNLDNAKNGSLVENIGVLGFSGYGISGLIDSTINNVYVAHCGLGINTKPDEIINNFRVQFCEYGLNLNNNVHITNGRIEEISKHGIYANQNATYPIVDNVALDQIGYAGIGVYSLLREANLNVENRRCCSYYSSLTASQILALATPLYEASAKIYVADNITFDNNTITDNNGLQMKIDDSSATTVTPLLFYSTDASFYGRNYIKNDKLIKYFLILNSS